MKYKLSYIIILKNNKTINYENIESRDIIFSNQMFSYKDINTGQNIMYDLASDDTLIREIKKVIIEKGE